MQVYKAFFKIISKNMSQIIIYLVVFVALAAILANNYNSPASASFSETKINIAFINHDGDSKLIDGLKSHLSQYSIIVDLPDDSQKLQDALFFRKVEYIVKVPVGFTEDMLKGNEVLLEKNTVPASVSEIYLDNVINKYLNTVRTYINTMGNLPQEEILKHVEMDLREKTQVEISNPVNAATENEKALFYFNYVAYSLFAILILGVCSVMIVFNSADLKRRNQCSPIKLRSMNLQVILGLLSYAVLAWFILILTSFIMYGSYMFTSKGLLFLLNSLIFTFAALSISYLISNLIKSRAAMSAATNVISLGTCFISGVFVPQELLGKSVLKIASFTPNYWYVKNNNIIVDLANFNIKSLTPIFLNMLIIIGFAAAVLSVTLVVIKQKRVSN